MSEPLLSSCAHVLVDAAAHAPGSLAPLAGEQLRLAGSRAAEGLSSAVAAIQVGVGVGGACRGV